MRLEVLMREVRACAVCEGLPLGPRPLVQGSAAARVLIIGQAPGAAAHRSGVPWDDASGRRLRSWLGVSDEQFYDERMVALMPMGFCYPGTGKGGDLAPRAECAPKWHETMRRAFRDVRFTVLIGRHALERYEPKLASGGVTGAVGAGVRLLPGRVVLPHPSPRNNLWLKRNPWFEEQVLPRVRTRVAEVLRE